MMMRMMMMSGCVLNEEFLEGRDEILEGRDPPTYVLFTKK